MFTNFVFVFHPRFHCRLHNPRNQGNFLNFYVLQVNIFIFFTCNLVPKISNSRVFMCLGLEIFLSDIYVKFDKFSSGVLKFCVRTLIFHNFVLFVGIFYCHDVCVVSSKWALLNIVFVVNS